MENKINIPKEKFAFAKREGKISDKKLETKPIGSFKDAMIRFRKNKSSVVAAVIILILFLYAFIVPFISHYSVNFRDGYYKMVLPKCNAFAWLGWDGCKVQNEPQAGYDYYSSIGVEYGSSAVKKLKGISYDSDGKPRYSISVDSYERVGFAYCDLTSDEYEALKNYQNESGIQVMYPMPVTYKNQFKAISSPANIWYKLADESATSTGAALNHNADGTPIFEANYMISDNPESGKYDSIRLPSDTGGANGDEWYVYAVRNQTGYRVRVLYKEYYFYKNGFYANHLFGTNQHGQDILACLASGARLSFILAISVSILNFIIGIIYGAIEGYYGGAIDLIMERISDVLASVPFIVVATLFQLHLAEKVGAVWSLLFAFVLTGWIGIASRVRTQFYRFKNQEYILAARTLGASDKRLIFRHILPNSIGTLITSTVLIIPGVIFSESMLSYLNIVNLELSNFTSIGTMLSNGQPYLNSYPHIILFPGVFIGLLEISFNLFGNGLRDAFNPSLRGADE